MCRVDLHDGDVPLSPCGLRPIPSSAAFLRQAIPHTRCEEECKDRVDED